MYSYSLFFFFFCKVGLQELILVHEAGPQQGFKDRRDVQSFLGFHLNLICCFMKLPCRREEDHGESFYSLLPFQNLEGEIADG